MNSQKELASEKTQSLPFWFEFTPKVTIGPIMTNISIFGKIHPEICCP